MTKVYWPSEVEWARIEPLMPRGRRGIHRVDDRRIISGIVHLLRSGARWRDRPMVYGPYTTVYNRFNRWSRQGLWLQIFETLTGQSPIHGPAMIDSPHFKAHRSAGGAKRGPSPGARPVARRQDEQAPRADRRSGPATCPAADRRQHQRLQHRAGSPAKSRGGTPPQGLAAHRHQLRQARPKPPQRSISRRPTDLLCQSGLDPRREVFITAPAARCS
jgi:transposase